MFAGFWPAVGRGAGCRGEQGYLSTHCPEVPLSVISALRNGAFLTMARLSELLYGNSGNGAFEEKAKG